MFPTQEELKFESPAHERAFKAVVGAVKRAMQLDKHPKTALAGVSPLFTYFEGLGAIFFHPKAGLVTGDELFHSNSDGWSRSMDLPAVSGVVDRTDQKNPKRCIRLRGDYGSSTYPKHVLEPDPNNPDSKYYSPSIEEDGTVRLARHLHTGETLYLPVTAEQAEAIARIFAYVDEKLKRRASWIEARIKNNEGEK